MQLLEKAMLWLVTTAVPVVIAACYGVAYNFKNNIWGRVVDGATGDGVTGIMVTCASESGALQSQDYSNDAGEFWVGFDQPCHKLVFEDIDGEENGGTYETKEVPFDGDAEKELVVQIHKAAE